MYSENNLIYILTMLECTEKCWIYAQDFSNSEEFVWANDQKEFNATISLFIAIGEESKKIDQRLKNDILTLINWSDIAGMRDKISHNYRGTDAEILWAIIYKDLPKLKQALVEMINLIDPPSELLDEFLTSSYYRHLQYLK